jgi:hypothetical protein
MVFRDGWFEYAVYARSIFPKRAVVTHHGELARFLLYAREA